MTTLKVCMFLMFLCMAYWFMSMKVVKKIQVQDTENLPVFGAGRASQRRQSFFGRAWNRKRGLNKQSKWLVEHC